VDSSSDIGGVVFGDLTTSRVFSDLQLVEVKAINGQFDRKESAERQTYKLSHRNVNSVACIWH